MSVYIKSLLTILTAALILPGLIHAQYEPGLDTDVILLDDPNPRTVLDGDVNTPTPDRNLIIDDFESYADEEFKEIWATWVDGYDDVFNGSIVGHWSAPETEIVHSGRQSMPFFYNNAGDPAEPFAGATYSEAQRFFKSPHDWSEHAVLSLWLYSDLQQVSGRISKLGTCYII